MPTSPANEDYGVMTVKCDQILFNGSIEMYTALVYWGSSTLIAMYGDGDPDITEQGKCKVDFGCTYLVSQTVAADPKIYQIFTPWTPQ